MDEPDDQLQTLPQPLAACDAFRDLARVSTVDPRYASRAVLDSATGPRPMTIEDHWQDISTLALHDGVPRVIRVHFETARNLLLYSWFAYRFQQVAEMHAYASIEYALRRRAGFSIRARTSLKRLLVKAVREGWIRDEGFRHYRRIAERRAEFERDEAALVEKGLDSALASEAQSYARTISETLPFLRNKLAHGSGMLSPSGKRTLALCCDLITQLYPATQGLQKN